MVKNKNKQIKGPQEGKFLEKYEISIEREQVKDPWTTHKIGVIKPKVKKEE